MGPNEWTARAPSAVARREVGRRQRKGANFQSANPEHAPLLPSVTGTAAVALIERRTRTTPELEIGVCANLGRWKCTAVSSFLPLSPYRLVLALLPMTSGGL